MSGTIINGVTLPGFVNYTIDQGTIVDNLVDTIGFDSIFDYGVLNDPYISLGRAPMLDDIHVEVGGTIIGGTISYSTLHNNTETISGSQ